MKRVETVLKRFGFIYIGKTKDGSKEYRNSSINRNIYFFSDNKDIFTFNGNVSYCDDKFSLDWISYGCKDEDTLRYAVLGFFVSGDALNAP